jgi:hypothetical protein
MALLQFAIVGGNTAVDYVDEIIGSQPYWVREDNAITYSLDIPNRTVRQGYSSVENNLASPSQKRHTLGVVGGNDVSLMGGNPQDIESELKGLTRPLTNCPKREYTPLLADQQSIIINNRKTNMAIDIRPVHLPEYQMWAYPVTYAPIPLRKETCAQPHKY